MSGLALLIAGGWVRLKLHRYLLLDQDGGVGVVGGGGAGGVVGGGVGVGGVGGGGDLVSTVLPWVLCGLGAAVLAVASAACHCAVRGAAAKLYLYSAFLLLVFGFELFLLGFAYRSSAALDVAFHDGLGRGLEEYGRDPEATEAVDDIQTTVGEGGGGMLARRSRLTRSLLCSRPTAAVLRSVALLRLAGDPLGPGTRTGQAAALMLRVDGRRRMLRQQQARLPAHRGMYVRTVVCTILAPDGTFKLAGV